MPRWLCGWVALMLVFGAGCSLARTEAIGGRGRLMVLCAPGTEGSESYDVTLLNTGKDPVRVTRIEIEQQQERVDARWSETAASTIRPGEKRELRVTLLHSGDPVFAVHNDSLVEPVIRVSMPALFE